MIKRVTIIVLDSLGIGEAPDAGKFGDEGADTFGHIIEAAPEIKIPNLRRLGFCNIEGSAGAYMAEAEPTGSFARLREQSTGKDTTNGHWEIAGLVTTTPFKTYPDGFPEEFIDKFSKAIGRDVIGNYPTSGTEIINALGEEHEVTGKPIVYTSSDSVFQIAVNTDVIPLEELYEICQKARDMLHGEWECGRVIARPYIKQGDERMRTSDRKDYSVSPPEETLLDKVQKANKTVYAVGKIKDIFNGRGITHAVHTDNNTDGVNKTIDALKQSFEGLIFTNLLDFDSKYGHRRDVTGYEHAIEEFDGRIPDIEGAMKDTDAVILCADHGNDPTYHGWNHTREYVPMVMFGKAVRSNNNLGTRDSFADIAATVAEILHAEKTNTGESFYAEIRRRP